MVSRGNLFPAQMAISCYRSQTYSNRELVIVTANPNSKLSDYVAGLEDTSIRCLQIPPMPLGDLRNASRDAAQGDFICNWDDDDLYGSHRIERQLHECLRSKAVGHFYNRVLLWWPNRKLLGISGPRRWENTMFVKREILPRYLPVALREDTPVVHLRRSGNVLLHS
jgi:glycosyltransferase involved in cell wall biosynthesis